jgi:hypothetical protein
MARPKEITTIDLGGGRSATHVPGKYGTVVALSMPLPAEISPPVEPLNLPDDLTIQALGAPCLAAAGAER